MDLSNWLKYEKEEDDENMITLYDWLKRKNATNSGYRMITLMYEGPIIGHKKACIKSSRYGYKGPYIATLTDEKESEFYTINYLLKNIDEEFLRDYYVTGEKVINGPCSFGDDFAYELIVSEIYNDVKREFDIWYPAVYADDKKPLEIKKIIIDGPATIIFWKDGTKTVTKCDKDDIPDYEKGVLYAALKKLSNKKEYNDILRKIDAWSECHNLYPDLFKIEKPKKKIYSVLDKIRAEIENHCGLTKENHCKYCSYCNSVMGVREILEIIDKYRSESGE